VHLALEPLGGALVEGWGGSIAGFERQDAQGDLGGHASAERSRPVVGLELFIAILPLSPSLVCSSKLKNVMLDT